MFDKAFKPFYSDNKRNSTFLAVFIGGASIPIWRELPAHFAEMQDINNQSNPAHNKRTTQSEPELTAVTNTKISAQKGVYYV